MNSMTPQEFDAVKNDPSYYLIDIREQYELDIVSLDIHHIPMAKLMDDHSLIPTDKKVIVCCKTGVRASAFADLLSTHYGFSNLGYLEGGVIGYVESIDSSLPTY